MEQTEERRRWNRLELAVPLFVSAQDAQGKAFTELTVALNISGGGALVALHKVLAAQSKVTVEIPRPPITELPSLGPHTVEALIVRIEPRNNCQLLGLQFAHPIEAPKEVAQ